MMAKEGFINLKFAVLYAQGQSDERFGIRKDWPELAAILDKALSSISEQERLRIFQRWSLPEIARVEAAPKTALPFELTDTEQNWLREHPKVRIGMMNAWPPMNFVNETGSPQGIGVDFIEVLNRRLRGILTLEPGSFRESFDRVKNRELDALMDNHPDKRA